MPDKLHIFAVSDSVGETAEKIAVASVLQFDIERTNTRFSRVTKEEQVNLILDRAVEEDAIIIYTIVKPELSGFLDEKARLRGVMAINVKITVMMLVNTFAPRMSGTIQNFIGG